MVEQQEIEDAESAGAVPEFSDATCRRTARAALFLLMPTAILAWLVVIASPRFARCLTYGEGCTAGAGPTAWWSFWAAAALGAVAATMPLRENQRHPRQFAMSLQVSAQALMAGAIVAQA